MDGASSTTDEQPVTSVIAQSDRPDDTKTRAESSGRAITPLKIPSTEEMQHETSNRDETNGTSVKQDPTLPETKREASMVAMDVDQRRDKTEADDHVLATSSSRRISGADYYAAPGVFAKDFASSDLPTDAQNDGLVDPQNPSPGGVDGRPLNVTDALSYLDAVKHQFHDRPDVYNRFLDIMKDFKSQYIDTPGVIERVSNLFSGHPELIQGFNTFLPVGYRIECSLDGQDRNRITVTTPEGTMTQSTTGLVPETSTLHLISNQEGLPYTREQIHPAIEYVTRIKHRFADHTDLYQEFLDILSTYKRPSVDEAQLTNRIAKLFENSPDLLSDFQVFMPRGGLPSAEVLGALNEPSVAEKLLKPSKSSGKRAIKGNADTASVAGSSGAPKRKRRPAAGEKEKEIERENNSKLPQGKAKRQRYPPLAAAPEPSYTPYAPASPPPHPSYVHAGPSTFGHNAMPVPTPYEPLPPPAPPAAVTSQDELFFFDRVRRALDNRETYNEFLKLINLFTQDIIDMRRLVERSFSFLGQGELMAQFKEILGWDAAWDVSTNALANDAANGIMPTSESMQRPTKADLRLRYGPSYRKLPASEVDIPCSGRDEMCRSVLNDEWVSHPTWASEDAGFVAHRKNVYEEALHRSEEERHEYDFHIEAITRTIAMMEPTNTKIMQTPPEERQTGKFKITFNGAGKAIYHRIIKKVYGREAGLDVIKSLVDCPGLAVPIVLARLKQKEEEWKKAQREWNKVWREVDAKNYQKSLDHQGISFKANDKKATTVKTFVNQIELAREEQMSKRASLIDPLLSRTRPRYQLSFVLEDTNVLQDLLKLTFSFLDRMQHYYSFSERRRMEAFLRTFFPMFFMLDGASFNAAFKSRNLQDSELSKFDDFSAFVVEDGEDTPSAGGPSRDNRNKRRGGGNDLRKKLLKSNANGSASRKARAKSSSLPASRLASPAPLEPIAVDEQPEVAADVTETPIASSETQPQYQKLHRRGAFFANSALYSMLRLIEIIYARLLSCKTLASKLASDPSSPYSANPVAASLALLDSDAPDAGLRSLRQQKINPASYFYDYLLTSCERLFDNDIDQQTFEDICRYMFGTKAYVMFTIDKMISSLLKQVQFILSDKSIRLCDGLKRERDLATLTLQDQEDLRMSAEKIIGSDENLFRIDWMPDSHTMTVQLIGKDDSNFDDFDMFSGRWQAYIDSFISDEDTKGSPKGKARPPFLARDLRAVKKEPPQTDFYGRSGLEIRVCVRTYRLFFVADTEDVLVRHWTRKDIQDTERRSQHRVAAQRKWLDALSKRARSSLEVCHT